jgi:hypothetical protein
MPTARDTFGMTLGPDGKIYVIGGSTSPYDDTPDALTTVEAYDPAKNTWTCSVGDTSPGCTSAGSTLAPLPHADRWLGAATGPDGLIHTVGGRSSTGGFTDAFVYDPSHNTWGSAVDWLGTYAVAVVTGLDGRIYDIGGLDSSTTTSKSAAALTTMTGTFGLGRIGIEGLTPAALPPFSSTTAGVYGGAVGSSAFGVEGVSASSAGLYGKGSYGVYGTGTYGLVGQGTYGLYASGTSAVYGAGSSNGRGGVFSGGLANIQLKPAATTTKPTSPQMGDLWVDSNGALWYYTMTNATTSPPTKGWKQIG